MIASVLKSLSIKQKHVDEKAKCSALFLLCKKFTKSAQNCELCEYCEYCEHLRLVHDHLL